jgi:sugar phosphate isomerase/epimerase
MKKTQNTIACRPGCLDVPLPEALVHLRKVGLHGAEVSFPADGDYKPIAKAAADAGLLVTSLSGGVHLDNPGQVATLERAIDGAVELGTKVIFLSAAPGEGTLESGIAPLRRLGERAHKAGVTLSIETHLPYGFNAATIRRTLDAANSKGLGWNYDTANIYYYNEKGTDGVAELKQGLDLVASVHLKESAKGEPKSFDFPVLGQGIVNFPAIFKLLGGRGFSGPYTLELEGALMDGHPTAVRVERVKACVDYLRSIGVM